MDLILTPGFRQSVRVDLLAISGLDFNCEHFQAFGVQNLQLVHNASIDIYASFDKPIPINFRCFESSKFNYFVNFVKQREWAFLRFEKQTSKFRCLTCNASHHCQHWASPTSDEAQASHGDDSKDSEPQHQQDEVKFKHDLDDITENGFLTSSSHSTLPFPGYSAAQKLKMVDRITSLTSQMPNGEHSCQVLQSFFFFELLHHFFQ
jgi:hypothetical protein